MDIFSITFEYYFLFILKDYSFIWNMHYHNGLYMMEVYL
jgi:hypothetical protein